MPEELENKLIFTLLEVTQSIQKTLAQRYTSIFWVKAEMNKLNYYSHSGHCYPELVEKKEGKIIAQIKSTLWKEDYEKINAHFKAVLKEPLKDGIKILFAARISFDSVYGLSLRIVDIDPAYTLGDLEKEKQETIARLKHENLFDKNKMLKLPLLPKRIAIISVETSKGYADFVKVIAQNPWAYKFFYMLFPSLLQGEKAVESITSQLNRIRKVIHHFDVVAIIRGGGGDVGLSCYNNYELSREIANFPIPVVTGIGHATNETVAEMISYQNAITPTKLAEFLIQQLHNFFVPVNNALDVLRKKTNDLIAEQKSKLQHSSRFFRSVSLNTLNIHKSVVLQQAHLLNQNAVFLFRKEKERVSESTKTMMAFLRVSFGFHSKLIAITEEKLKLSYGKMLMTRNHEIKNIEKIISVLNPENVLKRGYSMTLLNGKILTSQKVVKVGDSINTILADGSVFSNVISKQNNHDRKN